MDHTSLTEFGEKGFLVFKRFLKKQDLNRVRRDAQQVFISQMIHKGLLERGTVSERDVEAAMYKFFAVHQEEFLNCGKQVQYLLSLHRIGVHPSIERKLYELGLCFPNISTRPLLSISSRHVSKKDSYWLSPPHQDWRSMQGSLDSVVVWLPLVDVDASLGALKVVPGSHKRGLLATELVDDFGIVSQFRDEEFVSVEMEMGDALFFSSFLVHRSGTNVTESIRWSAHFRYNNMEEASFVKRGYPHAYRYVVAQELLTPDFIPDQTCLSEFWTRKANPALDQRPSAHLNTAN